jgi:hypothetical protein
VSAQFGLERVSFRVDQIVKPVRSSGRLAPGPKEHTAPLGEPDCAGGARLPGRAGAVSGRTAFQEARATTAATNPRCSQKRRNLRLDVIIASMHRLDFQRDRLNGFLVTIGGDRQNSNEIADRIDCKALLLPNQRANDLVDQSSDCAAPPATALLVVSMPCDMPPDAASLDVTGLLPERNRVQSRADAGEDGVRESAGDLIAEIDDGFFGGSFRRVEQMLHGPANDARVEVAAICCLQEVAGRDLADTISGYLSASTLGCAVRMS